MASGTIIIRAVKKPHNRNEIILKNFMPHQQNKKSDTMTEPIARNQCGFQFRKNIIQFKLHRT